MKYSVTEEQLIDFLSGELSPEESKRVEMALQQSKELKEQYEMLKLMRQEVETLQLEEPPLHLKLSFESMLEEEKYNVAHSPQVRKVNVLKNTKIWAALAAVMLIGILIGGQLQYYFFQQSQVATIQEELNGTRQQIEHLMQEQSTAKRIMAVNMSMDLDKVDQELRAQLIRLIVKDESPTVRLTAIDALIELDQSKSTQQALITALNMEQKPVVQIALIHALVSLEAQNAVPSLDELIDKEGTLDKVKDEARLGKFKLL